MTEPRGSGTPSPAGRVDAEDFYDDLAGLYDVIYVDWEAARRRHATAILEVTSDLAADRATPLKVLDVSAGIGTQALPMAEAGLSVTARDLSAAAIRRLGREAAARGLDIDAGACDMRSLDVEGPYDVVLSFDNSIPHLLDDGSILMAFREAHRVLAPGGQLVISVRDYATVRRGVDSVHRYGRRTRGDRTFDVRQEWVWVDPDHSRTTMVVDEEVGGETRERVRTTATYYAVEIPRLLQLMHEAGFSARIADEVDFYQPILTGRRTP